MGYEDAFECIDQFVENPHQGAARFTDDDQEMQAEDRKMRKESQYYVDPDGKYGSPSVIDYAAKSNDTNYPLIITGDAGCGKTHLIIRWLMRFNDKAEEEQSQDDSRDKSDADEGSNGDDGGKAAQNPFSTNNQDNDDSGPQNDP